MERIRRFFKGEKEKEPEDETEEERAGVTVEASVEDKPAPVEVPETTEVPVEEAAVEEIRGAIPYHESLPNRLMYMFGDLVSAADLKGPDFFKLEFMAMGERFNIVKPERGDVELKMGSASDEDVFIRISNDVVQELLSAATFSQFSDIYMRYYKIADAGKFVKIEIRKYITDLNRRGYARVPLLRLLVGQAR